MVCRCFRVCYEVSNCGLGQMSLPQRACKMVTQGNLQSWSTVHYPEGFVSGTKHIFLFLVMFSRTPGLYSPGAWSNHHSVMGSRMPLEHCQTFPGKWGSNHCWLRTTGLENPRVDNQESQRKKINGNAIEKSHCRNGMLNNYMTGWNKQRGVSQGAGWAGRKTLGEIHGSERGKQRRPG